MYYGEKRVENPIRWGMVGGGRGSQIGYIHRSAALRDFNFELVAGAFDIDPERGKDFGKQLHVNPDRCYPDYKTMFAEEAKRPDGVQAVSIATPNGMHYEVCKAALEAGLHVVCEKPLCFTSEQADELVKLAEEKHRVVGVTYGYSGHQLIQQARQMIKNGDLGEIRVINMSFAFGGYNFKIEDKVPSAKWRFDPSKAGPSFALGDVGTHPLFIIEAMRQARRSTAGQARSTAAHATTTRSAWSAPRHPSNGTMSVRTRCCTRSRVSRPACSSAAQAT